METVKNTPPTAFFEKIWVKYGLVAGFLAIIITVMYYVIDDALLIHPVLQWLPWFSIAVVAIFAALELKKQQDNFLAYSQAVTTSLAAFGIGLLFMAVFILLLYFFIDPDLLHDFTNAQIQALSNLVSTDDLSESSFRTLRAQIIDKARDMFVYQVFVIVIGTSILALILFLISSAILRREPNTQI